MKARVIQTRFWKDEFISETDLATQHLYIYLLTSEHINISGYFQLPDGIIKFETKLSDKELLRAKSNLVNSGKVGFHRGWVFVKNAMKNNNYVKSPDNQKAHDKEISQVPQDILKFFDSSVDSSVGVVCTLPRNKKSEIRNKKEGGMGETEVEKYLKLYNELTGKKCISTPKRSEKLKARMKTFSYEQIETALRNMLSIPWYKGENDRKWEAEPEWLLESDEKIDKFLNKKTATNPLRPW